MSDTAGQPQTNDILLIDADPLVSELLSEAFADEGYRVRVATNASDAIATIMASPPTYMLVDLQIPSVCDNFFAVLRAQGHSFPIALLTTLPALAQPLLVPDQVICIEKPFCLTALLECVAQYARPVPLAA